MVKDDGPAAPVRRFVKGGGVVGGAPRARGGKYRPVAGADMAGAAEGRGVDGVAAGRGVGAAAEGGAVAMGIGTRQQLMMGYSSVRCCMTLSIAAVEDNESNLQGMVDQSVMSMSAMPQP